jgi:hypothetical protein
MPPILGALRLPPRLHDRPLREITDDRTMVLRELRLVRTVVLRLAPDFVRHDARPIYSSYLLRHPRYVLANIIESWPIMFDQHAAGAPPFSAFRLTQYLSALDWLGIRLFVAIALTSSLLALVLVRGAWCDFLLQLGVILAFAGFANAVIGFHGDLWEVSEMGRHAWIGSTFLRLGCGVLCFRAISLLAADLRHRRGVNP